jgi:hypothetical protein
MIRTESRAAQLDELLGTSIAAIDIPPAIRARVVARYEEVAAFLAAHCPGAGDIHTQGSFRLGTVVAPVAAGGEYDMDLVYLRHVHRDSISKLALNREAGPSLQAFTESSPEGSPELEEGKRCWTLDYPGEPFHMTPCPRSLTPTRSSRRSCSPTASCASGSRRTRSATPTGSAARWCSR